MSVVFGGTPKGVDDVLKLRADAGATRIGKGRYKAYVFSDDAYTAFAAAYGKTEEEAVRTARIIAMQCDGASPTHLPADQQFDSFDDWVNHASSRLTNHPLYCQGDLKRGEHYWDRFVAICIDAKGRLCRNGGDFARARDEGAFPVRWVWPDQVAEALSK